MSPVIPLTSAHIQAMPGGWTVEKEDSIRIYTLEGKLLSDSVFTEVAGNADFYAVKKKDSWSILRTNGTWFGSATFDEVNLLGNHLFVVKQKKNLSAYSPGGKLIKLPEAEKIRLQLLSAYDNQSWIILENKRGKKGILSVQNGALLPPRYDDIQVWEPDLYKTELKGKFGLVNAKGKILLPAIYDGLDYQKGLIATLKNGKFGLMNVSKSFTIPPQYSALLRNYDQSGRVLIAAKAGRYGLIGADNKPLSEFVFDEIQYWQNEVALVRQDQTWYLYHFVEKRYIFKPIDFIEYIKQSPEEIVLKVYMDKMYGILSNTKGQVVSCDYEDLANVGSETFPLYLGEKYIDDADIYLVFYINREGQPMRRQIFNANKYQRMLCD
ncbi:WG repeat-containing protein [Rhodocytophaga rosea]|uniref:WG repeat-containing protein n=1 Tax=Rhodocytophaga rosea TaxID=2704465 RepID=A0A6C0GH74_9BACT|nr:WG repeat-containing protein [Rhodocytophaga rosea]QHT67050.1 WG repeat-containing protein [Rhodocytophaga rosea]